MSLFNKVAKQKVGRSVFDLSYEKKFTLDMGYIYPVLCDEMVPGDVFEISNAFVLRWLPTVAPLLHEVNCYVHYFFVPNRILDSDWEEWITGGDDGAGGSATLPTWTPTDTTIGSLWDYLGFPVGVDPQGTRPVAFPQYAYNMIWNEYYRDENLDTEVNLTDEDILLRRWEKDYFTSALSSTQLGTAPALPVTISGDAGDITLYNASDATARTMETIPAASGHSRLNLTTDPGPGGNARWSDPGLSAATFDITDFRLTLNVQRWMERNKQSGHRYTEFLQSHFNVSPNDARLQRPEYIGGSKSPVIFSEVLKTSEEAAADSTEPQGWMAGHGISVDKRYIGKYRAEEFGVIMGLMSVMPRTAYEEGVDRQWIKSTRYDYYFPEFAHLSEQAVYNGEIYAQDANPTANAGIFGYQGRYNEMRYKQSRIAGQMRKTGSMDYWHIGRQFSSLPTLGTNFIRCLARKDFLAAPSDPTMVCSFGNIIKAVRPLPVVAVPGI